MSRPSPGPWIAHELLANVRFPIGVLSRDEALEEANQLWAASGAWAALTPMAHAPLAVPNAGPRSVHDGLCDDLLDQSS